MSEKSQVCTLPGGGCNLLRGFTVTITPHAAPDSRVAFNVRAMDIKDAVKQAYKKLRGKS